MIGQQTLTKADRPYSFKILIDRDRFGTRRSCHNTAAGITRLGDRSITQASDVHSTVFAVEKIDAAETWSVDTHPLFCSPLINLINRRLAMISSCLRINRF